MNLGHFCDPDPERNNYPSPTKAFDPITKNWTTVEYDWPIHEACNGYEVIYFGLETELIVKCDCECHDNKV